MALPALSQVLPVQPARDAPGREQAEQRAAFAQLQVGQLVTGKVLGHSRDMTLVRIENHTVAMRLPRHTSTGENLKLSFAGFLPNPVFVLEATQAQSSTLPQLSQTARMLSDIMQRVPERTPPTLAPPVPLLAQPPAASAELAYALRQALVRSGLFYESHLANWVAGKDSLEGLLREPQNRAGTQMAQSAETGPKPASPLLVLLTQQLQMLESPHFIWRGELWPGQQLEWQLRREEAAPDRHPGTPTEADEAGTWDSHLKLDLPVLGQVTIDLKLDSQQRFRIQITPARPDTESRLRDQQALLTQRLDAAGLHLGSLAIHAPEQDDVPAR